MEHLVEISQRDWEAILAGRRPDGRMIGVTDDDGGLHIRFERFNRQPKPKASDVLLYETANGWLKVSPQRLKIWVSTKRDLGLRRGGALRSQRQAVPGFYSQPPQGDLRAWQA